MTAYKIKEQGRNGSVEVLADRLVRNIKHRLGKTDTQTIPIRAINAVHHDRKLAGADRVRVDVGATSYEWKVADGEAMVAELNDKIC